MGKFHILCTGGAGYIGSHTVVHLLKTGKYDVSILDNLSNANQEVIARIEEITGQKVPLHNVDIRDKQALSKLFQSHRFDGVIHYAALKAVGESVAKPLEYYENNIGGTVNLLMVMRENNVKVIVFSSSATVYQPCETPLTEDAALGASNPYGHSKVMNEQVLRDLHTADNSWKVSVLRYFNPVGAHPSGRIGEYAEHPNNLLPFIQQVVLGRRPHLNVFGNDWPTRDGTGVRDYIHVEDLAEGHIAALDMLLKSDGGIFLCHNLGTGKGVSVLELAKCMERASGRPCPVKFVERRPGDLATVIADPSKANRELGWYATRSIMDACAASWKWQSNNPYGYDKEQKNAGK